MLRNLFDAPHLIILGVIVLLIFAAPKLPGMAKNLGKSMKIFKNEVKSMRDDDEDGSDDADSSADDADTQRPIQGNIVDKNQNSTGRTTSSKPTRNSDS